MRWTKHFGLAMAIVSMMNISVVPTFAKTYESDAIVEKKTSKKPTLNVSQSRIDTIENKPVDLSNYVSTDKDATISYKGDVDYSKMGTYSVKVTATNKNGSTSSTLSVQVNHDDFYDKVAQAAKDQVGVSQDCTMLVTNALAAGGIQFHGAPEDYLTLGPTTDQPVPGDICVYQGHVALYIGDGQAVHGGYAGNQTVISSVECTNAFIAYVHVSH